MTFTQTDTALACTGYATCSARSLAGLAGHLAQASVGAAAGSGTTSAGCTSSESNVIMGDFECIIPSGSSGNAGTWTVRINVTTANMNLTITEIYICQISAACANVATIGSATGLSISLGSTGVKTQTVSGNAVTLSNGDKALILVIGSNGAMSNQTFGITRDQNIDSPFTAGVPKSLVIPTLDQIKHILVR